MGIRLRFRVGDSRYVYDATTNQILELPEDLYNVLPGWARLNEHRTKTARGKSKNCRDYAELAEACQEDLLSNKLPLLINPLEHCSQPEAFERNLSDMTLSVTERCNLRCVYCDYTSNMGSRRNHSQKTMSLQTAKKALAYFHKCVAGDEDREPSLGFYGGEPLLVFSRIQEIVELAHTFFSPGSIAFRLTTNATIMNQEIAHFLADNDFNLLVSLDGPSFKHNRYRKTSSGEGSYEMVMKTLSILKKEVPDYFARKVRVNMVATPPLELQILTSFLISEFPVSLECCNITLVNSSENNFLKDHQYTVKDVKAFKALYKQAEDCFISGEWADAPLAWIFFSREISSLAFRSKVNLACKPYVPTGQCLPGGYKLYVDANGVMHLCERIDEGAAIGHVDTGMNPSLVREVLGPFYEDALKTCVNCYGLRHCGVCLSTTISNGRFSKKKKSEACTAALRRLRKRLISYVRIIEQNPKAFNHLSPPLPQKSFATVLNI